MRSLIAVFILTLASLLPAAAQDAEVTASDVVDRETLKAFVLAAKAYADNATTLPEYISVLQELRTEETWKYGSIYLFVLTTEGTAIFHAENPDLEGQDLYDLEDANGVKFVQEFIAVAAEGGGYVEYLWPDPLVEGDEEIGSPKVSYVIPYAALGQNFILGSGFYPESASTAVTGQSWGQLKSRF